MRKLLLAAIALFLVLAACQKEVQTDLSFPEPDYREKYCGDWEIYVHQQNLDLLAPGGTDTTHYYHTHLNATISMDPNSTDSLFLDRGIAGWGIIKFPVDGAGAIYNCASNGNLFGTDSISFRRVNSGDCINYSAGGYTIEYFTGVKK